MPTAYAYTRVSTQRQTDSGAGLDAQEQMTRAYYEFRLAPRGVAWGRVYSDPAVSATRLRFLQRPAGAELDQVLAAGDAVIVTKIDRAFRNIADFALTVAEWDRRGVEVHLLDVGVDTSLATGKLVASILAAVAEWETRRIGQRIAEAHAARRAAGRSVNGVARIGYRLEGKLHVPDEAERRAAQLAVKLRARGLYWYRIAEEMSRRGIPRRGGLPWTKQHARYLALAAQAGFP